MEELDESDMQLIATAAFKRLPSDLLTKMIGFTSSSTRGRRHRKLARISMGLQPS